MKSKKYVVIGDGWLGRELADRFDTVPEPLDDLGSAVMMEAFLQATNPDVVVNTVSAPRKAKKLVQYRAHAVGPRIFNMVKNLINPSIQFVHISDADLHPTGTVGAAEDDPVEPVDWFSRSKYYAETLLPHDDALILRTRNIFSHQPHLDNLITRVSRETVLSHEPTSAVSLSDLGYCIEILVDRKCTGVYNVFNPGVTSYYSVAEEYQAKVNPGKDFYMNEAIRATNGLFANVVVDTTKLQDEDIKLPSVNERIRDIMEDYAIVN